MLLIGDAAHAISPNAGQGTSLALEDAMYHAKLFRDLSAGHEQVFTRFETERGPRVKKIVVEGWRAVPGQCVTVKCIAPLCCAQFPALQRLFKALYAS